MWVVSVLTLHVFGDTSLARSGETCAVFSGSAIDARREPLEVCLPEFPGGIGHFGTYSSKPAGSWDTSE